jgi:hypothetical protein
MRRWLLAALLCLIAVPALAASMLGSPGGGTPTAPSYQGPCDVITGGCAEAYSFTRDMTSAYSGNLFQLTRLSDNTTLNVGTTANVVNTSSIPAFCRGTYCLYSIVYAQINGNNLLPSGVFFNTPFCTTANACAGIFWIDPTTGLPSIRTSYPVICVHEPTSTGLTGGANALSVMMDVRNEGNTTCCGAFGASHAGTAPDTIGTMFEMWLDYGTAVNTFMDCSSAVTFCAGIDPESANRNGADYGSTLQDVIGFITFSGGATGGTVTVNTNGTQIFTVTPPAANTAGHNMNVGTSIHFGGGGDLSHVDVVFREGLITNNVISPTDGAAATSNMTTFYGAHSPSACQSVADMGYYFGSNSLANYYDNSVSNALMAYGLRKMRASQTGPIVDLEDVVTSTIHTYGPAASGCGLDPAAATFCATNGCSVSKLYSQSIYNTAVQTSSSFYDTTLSMTAASTAAQPTVTFNSLNGQATMHFTGSQMLCSGTLPAFTTNQSIIALPTGWSVVARHAAASGVGAAASQVYSVTGAITSVGWGSAANTFNSSVVSTTSPQLTGTASDGHWHQMGWESTNNAGTTGNSYVDGTTVASGVTVGASGNSVVSGQVCLGGVSGSPNFSGDVAELLITLPRAPTTVHFSSLESAIFGFDQTAWGTLPN